MNEKKGLLKSIADRMSKTSRGKKVVGTLALAWAIGQTYVPQALAAKDVGKTQAGAKELGGFLSTLFMIIGGIVALVGIVMLAYAISDSSASNYGKCALIIAAGAILAANKVLLGFFGVSL